MPDIYTSGDYARRNPGWHREHSEWKAARAMDLLRAHNVAPVSVAEVGCGAGGILAAIQRALPAGATLTGYDIATDALELARPLANERLRFVRGDFLALETPRYDLLLTMDVVEHVPDYLGFLSGLRPKAAAHLFHLPLDLSLLSMMNPRRLRWAFESVGHLHYFTKETALTALENAGFTVTGWRFTAVELDLPPPEAQRQRLRPLRRLGRAIAPEWTARVLGGFSLLALCQ